MADARSGKKLQAVLWFIAAALALIAFGIRIFGEGNARWTLAAGALFCLFMGISALKQGVPPK
jgi:hypothetical protein